MEKAQIPKGIRADIIRRFALSNDQLAEGGIKHTQGHQNKDRAAHTRQKLGASTAIIKVT